MPIILLPNHHCLKFATLLRVHIPLLTDDAWCMNGKISRVTLRRLSTQMKATKIVICVSALCDKIQYIYSDILKVYVT